MEELHLTSDRLASMERFYRANLVNSLSGFKQAMLLGTQDREGLTNLALFSSIVHLGADPALLGFIQRPVGVSGDSFRNLTATGFYTLNHVHEGMMERAHQTSARYPPDVSEFEACHLTPLHIDGFPAPFVGESRVRIGMELVEVIPITHNDTKLVVGRVLHIHMPGDCLMKDGNIDLNSAGGIAVSGLETYHRVERIAQMSYAKADRRPPADR
jgi:flavin reductase (DIM6/NTAB) family NADH-FMN oxidoreductase RutF